jgi:hypothetical protein
MAKKIIGKGSKYAYTYLDADGNPLDGGKTRASKNGHFRSISLPEI